MFIRRLLAISGDMATDRAAADRRWTRARVTSAWERWEFSASNGVTVGLHVGRSECQVDTWPTRYAAATADVAAALDEAETSLTGAVPPEGEMAAKTAKVYGPTWHDLRVHGQPKMGKPGSVYERVYQQTYDRLFAEARNGGWDTSSVPAAAAHAAQQAQDRHDHEELQRRLRGEQPA